MGRNQANQYRIEGAVQVSKERHLFQLDNRRIASASCQKCRLQVNLGSYVQCEQIRSNHLNQHPANSGRFPFAAHQTHIKTGSNTEIRTAKSLSSTSSFEPTLPLVTSILMEHTRRSGANDEAASAWSTHETDGSCVYSVVHGNVTDISSLSRLSSQIGHGAHQCDGESSRASPAHAIT
jgi:hypothetical protein